ncbi:hypothetical protein B7486_26530 [cyanobacterium TDX16]|nr:hypothetical protein B7486_26530 [cyanobacterium TDX16]
MYERDRHWKATESPNTQASVIPIQQTPDCDEELAPAANCDRITPESEQWQIELLLSNLLRYGVFFASAVVLVGGILYLIRHGTEPVDYKYFLSEPDEFRSPFGIVKAAVSGSSRGIIQLGVLLSIATPIARVAISLLAFLWRRDFTYIAISLFVLLGLLYSLLGAYF